MTNSAQRIIVAGVAAAAVALSLAVVASVGGRPAPTPSAPASPDVAVAPVETTIAAPTPYPTAADGVPTTIDGEPVLRGAAIRERLACGDSPTATPSAGSEPFLAAGWLAVRRDQMLSLIEAKTDHPTTWYTLFGNGMQLWQEPQGIRWSGGFVVLRVMPTCEPWPGSTLLVSSPMREPTAGVPAASPTPATVDEAGIPLAIDGAPVLRGTAIRERVAAGGASVFVVAGWLQHVSADCAGPKGQIVGCDFTELIDPQRGLSGLNGGVPVVDERGGTYSGGKQWPGGSVVLRVRAGCGSDTKRWLDNRCVTVVASVDPPATAPGPTPLPMPSQPPVVWDGEVPVQVGEDRLWEAPDLASNLAELRRIPKKVGIVVAGHVAPAKSGCTKRSCASASLATTLVEPLDLARSSTSASADPSRKPVRFQLLGKDGSPFVGADRDLWANDLRVLDVQPWKGVCPWSGSCSHALVVVKAIRQPITRASASGRVTLEGGLPTAIDSEPVVADGDAIKARAAQPGEFYVSGRLAQGQIDCAPGGCPTGETRMLRPEGAATGQIPLLSSRGIWSPPGDLPRWSNGLVVLRVRGWSGTCPWTSFCESGVMVVDALAP
jgi:hypothetical protein